jgi:soluble lytic murein transglycosylase-like protein
MVIESALAYLITANSHIDAELAAAVAFAESSLRCDVGENYAGAIGLMQVKPVAAQAVGMKGADLFDCATNIAVGTKYLSGMIERFGLYDGLRAYNCGPRGSLRNLTCGAAYANKILRVRDEIHSAAENAKW